MKKSPPKSPRKKTKPTQKLEARLPDWASWADWDKWIQENLKIVTTAISKVAGKAKDLIFSPFETLSNFKIARLFTFLNNPHAAIENQIRQKIKVEDLYFYKIISSIKASKVVGIISMLDAYVERLDSIEWAVSSLLGRQFPLVEAISTDIHCLLQSEKRDKDEFPKALLTLLDQTSGTVKRVLHELQLFEFKLPEPGQILDIGPGHFYEWVCCNTQVDLARPESSDKERLQQQQLRYTMLKVILTYIEHVDLSPEKFKQFADPANNLKNSGGFPLSTTNINTVLHNSNSFMRAYAGLVAGAFEHIFVSTPLSEWPDIQKEPKKSDVYHGLPMTLKMLRPDLFKVAYSAKGQSIFNNINLDMDSEFLSMKIATTTANVTSGLIHTGFTSICNGVWEISPNNVPLVDNIASLVAIPIYELEKAFLYDVLRRFRVYVTDQAIDTNHQCVLMRTSMKVPDFSDSDATEKTLTAVVAVHIDDHTLLDAGRSLFGNLPVDLDADEKLENQGEFAHILHGQMKDALAIAYVVNS